MMEDESWENGQDLSSMESESQSDSSELESDSSEEGSSSEVYSIVLEQDYSTGHISNYSDFYVIGFSGILIGFGLAIVFALVTLAFSALFNILQKGVQ